MLFDETDRLSVKRASREFLKPQVVNMLRAAIQAGEFQPGERLIEENLAHKMSVSRVPIREALRILEGEGLVISAPGQGTCVIDLTEKDIREIYSLRSLYELYAIDNLKMAKQKGYFVKLQDVIDQMAIHESKDSQTSKRLLLEYDLSFHESLCIGTENDRLVCAWQKLKGQLLIILSWTAIYNDASILSSNHQEIIDCLRSGKSTNAKKLLKTHIAYSEEQILKRI